jgi:DNA-binding MarR family transcriptional regulator
MVDLLEKAIKDLLPTTSRFKVLMYLSFKGPSHPGQIADDTGMPSGTIRPALRYLLGKRFLTQQSDGAYKSKIAFTEIISDLYMRKEK